jgi:hypothetical protein
MAKAKICGEICELVDGRHWICESSPEVQVAVQFEHDHFGANDMGYYPDRHLAAAIHAVKELAGTWLEIPESTVERSDEPGTVD